MKNLKKIKLETYVFIFYMLSMFNFILNRKVNCFLINVGITVLTYYVIKRNLEIAMLLGLIMSNFIFTCSKIIEGSGEDGEEDEEEDDEEDEEDKEDDEEEGKEEDVSEEIDTEKLAKAIENAKKTGRIITSDSAEKIAAKQKKKLQRQFQRCASASLRPINECIADRNKKIDGTDDADDDDDDNDE
tara:strand:+ start:559 stop:1119 length:561 start_codon:yes stop_codon:yes gene_type:complete